jgi:anti-sigma B factor antagonist
VTLVSDRPVQTSPAPMERFEVRVRPDRDVVHLEPAGELDMSTAPLVRGHVDELVAAGFTDVVIDLRGLEFIDCSGVRLLLALDAGASSDGWRLTLVQGHPAIERLFALTGTLDALPFTSADGLGARPR